MLPNFADVATNEEAGNVLRKLDAGKEVGVRTFNGWSARIIFRSTDTSHCLVLLFVDLVVIFSHLGGVNARGLIWVVVMAALTSAA